jgi:hypothetical protein
LQVGGVSGYGVGRMLTLRHCRCWLESFMRGGKNLLVIPKLARIRFRSFGACSRSRLLVYRSCKLVLVLCGNARYMVLSFCLFVSWVFLLVVPWFYCWFLGLWEYEFVEDWKCKISYYIHIARSSRSVFMWINLKRVFVCCKCLIPYHNQL